MHLTNYAINKNNPNFSFPSTVATSPTSFDVPIEPQTAKTNSSWTGTGHKRSMAHLFDRMSQEGVDTATLWRAIKDIVIKTMITAKPHLRHTYKAA
jgi:hypothetical protein